MISLSLKLLELFLKKKKLANTIIILVNMVSTCCIKIKRKNKNNVDNY